LNRSPGTTTSLAASAAAAFALVLTTAGCQPPTTPPPTTPAPPSAQPGQAAALQDRPSAPADSAATASAGKTSNASTQPTRPIAASAAPLSASANDADVIARVGTVAITKDQLLKPMIEAHGLTFLLQIVQLDLARQAAAAQGVKVTQDDFKEERKLTFRRMFEESDAALRDKIREAKEAKDNATVQKLEAELNLDKESLLDQYLQQQYVQSHQYVSRTEFDLALETNTFLRKIAEASPELKNAINDDLLRKTFAQQFGEKVVVRHIQANNLGTLQEAKNRIDKGENFADVAKAMSTNKNTAPLGGAIPAFTMNEPRVPAKFKEVAFELKNGEVSDPVEADNAWHLIKVENRIPPKVVKFEDVKETIRAQLYDKILQAAVAQLRDKVSKQLFNNLRIENPALKAQFDKRVEEGRVKQKEQIDAAMKRSRPLPTTEPAARDLPIPTPEPGAKAPAPTTAPTLNK
jgi:parvulin-like peptidyl-prolyl isomerase